jgi:hypothetical protein
LWQPLLKICGFVLKILNKELIGERLRTHEIIPKDFKLKLKELSRPAVFFVPPGQPSAAIHSSAFFQLRSLEKLLMFAHKNEINLNQ